MKKEIVSVFVWKTEGLPKLDVQNKEQLKLRNSEKVLVREGNSFWFARYSYKTKEWDVKEAPRIIDVKIWSYIPEHLK